MTVEAGARTANSRLAKRNRLWIGFFVVLATLAGVGIFVEIGFNLRQQLTPEQIADARTHWQQRGPEDYDFAFRLSKQGAPTCYEVVIQDGEIREVHPNIGVVSPVLYPFYDIPPLFAFVDRDVRNGPAPLTATVAVEANPDWSANFAVTVRRGKVVAATMDDQPLPEPLLKYYDMPALYAGLGAFLELDAASPLSRPYSVASFDRVDGHLLRYVRSRMHTRERIEFALVRFEPVKK
jgi:hypothetical protein